MNNKLIIDKPALKSLVMRILEALFSTTAWAIFLYFCQPFFTIVFWLLTGYWIQLHFFSDSLILPMMDILFRSFLFSLVSLLLLMSWSLWNVWRYGGLDRRKPRPMVLDTVIAATFSVPITTLTRARNAKLALITPTTLGVFFTLIKKT